MASGLLTTALRLMTVVQQYPFVDAWLTVKVLLLVVYIGLGIYAFRTRHSRGVRWTAWLAALLVFGFIVSVALAHDPWGLDRKSVVSGQRVSVRVDLGGRRVSQKKNNQKSK